MDWRKKTGFTLVELLVSITILAILLVVVLVAINIPKQMIAARDLQRKMDVKQLADSLASYYTEQKNIPPQDLWYSIICGDNAIPQALQPFMSSFLCDPQTKDHYYYETLDMDCQPCNDVICQKFRILTALENPADQSIPTVGCDQKIGCGPYTQTGLAYNYGASLGCPLKTDSLAWQTSQTALKSGLTPMYGKILEVDISSQPSLTYLTQENGYPEKTTYQNPQYTIVLLDTDHHQIFSKDFALSTQNVFTDFVDNTNLPTQSNFVLTLPWYDEVATVAILTLDGTQISSFPISKMTIKNNTPSYITIPGSSVKSKPLLPSFFELVPKVHATGSTGKIDLVFVGDGFTTTASQVLYHQKVNEFINQLLTYEPFKSRASIINFHYLDNMSSLGCYPCVLNCWNQAISLVNSAGAPYDAIYVISNNTNYGGTASPPVGTGTINDPWGSQIFVHEIAHALAWIADEYITNGTLKSDVNCYSRTPPNLAWKNIISDTSYFQGCSYSNWYRTSETSIMRAIESYIFNPVTQYYINLDIDRRLGLQVIPTLIPLPTNTPTPTPLPTSTPTPTPTPPPTSGIGGYLTDCETHEPLAGQTIYLGKSATSYGGAASTIVATDSQGHFNFSSWSNPIYYSVRGDSVPDGYFAPARTPQGSFSYENQQAGNSDCSTQCNLCYYNVNTTVPTPTPIFTTVGAVGIQGRYQTAADQDQILPGQKLTITGPSGAITTTNTPTWNFNQLLPGKYIVTPATLPGYKTYSTYCGNSTCLKIYSSGWTTLPSLTFYLKTPGDFADVRFMYEVTASGSATPTPLPSNQYTIGGSVVDCDTNAPLGNVPITLVRDSTSFGGAATVHMTTNTTQGAFVYTNWYKPLTYGIRVGSPPAGYSGPALTTTEEKTEQYGCAYSHNNTPLGSSSYECQAAGKNDCSWFDSKGIVARCTFCFRKTNSTGPTSTPVPTTTPVPTATPTPYVTPVPQVMIQGHHQNTSGTDLVLTGQKVTISGPSGTFTSSTTPYWYFNKLTPGIYTITAANISGYAIYSSVCANCSPPPDSYVLRNSLTVNLPVSGNWADVYFKYEPLLTPTPTSGISPDKLSCYCKDNSVQTQCANLTCSSSREIDAICIPLCTTHGGLQATACFDNNTVCMGATPTPDELTCYCLDNTNQTQCVNIDCTSNTDITSACPSRCSTHGGMKAGGCTDNASSCTGITPTTPPTPTPNPCTQGFSASLSRPLIETPAGQTVAQTLTITNNNPVSCGTTNYAISYSHPTVLDFLNLPPSINLSGGQSQAINFSIIVTASAAVGDHLTQFWINNSSPYNATIRVTATAPTPTPSTNMFSNLSAKTYGDYAMFKYSYAGWGLSDFRVDVATNPTALNQTVGPNDYARYGFAFGSGTPMDPSNTATPTSIRSVIQTTPQGWYKWTCGTTIYWRMYKSAETSIMSQIQTSVVDCTTQINILPWAPWYQAIYYGVYDARYDPNNDGVVNWYDYWILVDQTRLR
jgi:prepilin-type N-terminal cleavage/methylation domain-containing protein